MSFDRSGRGAGRGPAPAAGPAAPPGPGKQTLTAQLDAAIERSEMGGGDPAGSAGGAGGKAPRGIVQQRAAARAPEADVHAAAAHGITGGATALPHLTPIQQAFGRHDVGHIRAHVGGAAAEGAAAMGASAFAVGDHVAFAAAPDLHTAAHEAAHVVQQRAGIQLKGGVGEAGDRHEQHADAVADLVVQGKSAEATLDPYATASAGAAPGGVVQRHAFINGAQVKRTDSFVTGDMVDFVTDTAVRDYQSVDELKNHVAGQTDYLGNMPDDINTWVRFSPTGLNVLGEAHDTSWSLKHTLAAVHSKNFISEAIASEAPTDGSQLKTAYDAHNADRYKDLGIENEKDKSKFGAEPLPPKIGFGMVQLLPYLNLGTGTKDTDKNVHKLKKDAKPDDYPGQIYLSLLQMGWAHAKDSRLFVAMMHMAGAAVPPKLDALAQVTDSVLGTLDHYLTGLPAHGWLGDTLADPANAKLVPPLVKLVEALIDMLTERAVADPSSGLDAKQRKKFAGKTTGDEKEQMFLGWRDAGLQHAVKDAAAHHVRYAGMGSGHLKPLKKAGLPANTQVYDMSGKEIGEFDQRTRELAGIAVKQR